MKSAAFLAFWLLFSAGSLFSLSPEEKDALPAMSKEDLIKIILIYDETLNQIEIEKKKNDQILTERKNLLDERETDLTARQSLIESMENRAAEREASLIVREQIFQESLNLQKEITKAKFWNGFAIGAGSGFVVGGLSGYGAKSVISQFQ